MDSLKVLLLLKLRSKTPKNYPNNFAFMRSYKWVTCQNKSENAYDDNSRWLCSLNM